MSLSPLALTTYHRIRCYDRLVAYVRQTKEDKITVHGTQLDLRFVQYCFQSVDGCSGCGPLRQTENVAMSVPTGEQSANISTYENHLMSVLCRNHL
jgi:hypothetical protein